ncbi:MAG: hypothetical protein COX79_04380 [Candidatus Levybacteria bacterium CG_4_10_14_0_2_um_filter_36_16]|nr:MAG: hypothetical protein AUK12_02180 [Candidatus Levybacteria bacterium CG2_30_37_29]PIR79389.1 MAG: hypothetical protein COU26_01515 [Candidatus Levybacteria bacterium CG10_big_fil_rev_8_21_14_0_10_36_30]PIZ96805.1 MAG: hypothetical protein COX79_04380 [Candidatus Levybacteria bacterium CG_4_10_14_0_2_um_filter_36_16]PJA90415.1 MAG: hypothetical protein CO136_02130 [Candidatus Levybacteria bacterium CG_4_9_14_3_um_filter_36_7]
MALLEFLFTLFIISLPIGVIGRIGLGSQIFIYSHDLILLCIFTISTLYFIKKKSIPHPRNIFVSFLVFFIFGIFSLIVSPTKMNFQELSTSFLYDFRFLMYVNLIFALSILSKKFKDRILLKLSLSGVVFIALGFVQYFLYPNLKNLYYLGWDEHLYRLFSTVLDPNFAGVIIVLTIITILHFLVQKNIKKPIVVAILFLSIVSLFLTYSRSSIIMFVVSISTFFILKRNYKTLILIIVLMIFSIILIPKDFSIENMNPFRSASIIGRGSSMKAAIKVFESSPIYGVGFNSLRYSQRKLGVLDTRFEITHAGAGVPNSYLVVLATTGLIGFIIFLTFLFFVIKEAFLVFAQKKSSESIVTISCLFGIFVGSLFENILFYPIIAIWIFTLVGVTVYRRQ